MKKKYYVLLIIMLIVGLISVNVYAANSFTTTMTPSSTNVSEATEVVITVAVSNINIDNGINSFSAYLAYDTDVFETLTDSSVEGLNGWSATYSTSSGMVALLKSSFVSESQEIMQITLKVKEGVATGTDGTVALSSVKVSNSDEEITGSNVSTTITVGTGTSNTVTNISTNSTSNVINITTSNTSSNNTNNTVTSNSTSNNSTINVSTNATTNTNALSNSSTNSTYNSSVTNSSEDDIPYTGSESSAFIKIILGVVLISLVIYIKFKKIDEDVK